MNKPTAASGASWEGGWYRFARHVQSPNFGPRSARVAPDLVVLHCISLPPGVYGGTYVQALFTNQLDAAAHPYFQTLQGLQVSSHFYIQRQGELWQFVSCDDRAWHAGVSHYRNRDNCNNYSIGIEFEGLEGDRFEDAQYETLQSLVSALAGRYPIAHIAGHEHVAVGRKNDPGPGMDWALLQRSLGLGAHCFPEITKK